MIRWRPKRPRPSDLPPLEPEEQDDPQELARARRARETSEQGLADVCERWPEVNRLGASLRRHRSENHFLELFERAVRGGDGGKPDRG